MFQCVHRMRLIVVQLSLIACLGQATHVTAGEYSPERGLQYLLEKPYLTPDFTDEEFNSVWKVWPESLRAKAEQATPAERRRMAFERYGLTLRPGDTEFTETSKPLQYVVDNRGTWTMNCLSCHAGTLQGQLIPGLPNTQFALQTMSEELRDVKLQHFPNRPLTRMQKGASVLPLGHNRGTTNAVVFGIGLMSMRDPQLNLLPLSFPPRLTHHDMDAPAWWHYSTKTHLYVEGYAPKNHRNLMQFMLIRSNGPEKFQEWEDDFRHIAAYLDSIPAPKYNGVIDQAKAARGAIHFQNNCASCHGTYGDESHYPSVVAALSDAKTDPVRMQAVTDAEREMYSKTWFTNFGEEKTNVLREGYVAPPLDGVWASAPYLHNGSVPTLWHILNPSERPQVWKRKTRDGFDAERVGLDVEEFKRIPKTVHDIKERREYFDTKQFGKSAAGHDYPDVLTLEEKHDLLEYLKTL